MERLARFVSHRIVVGLRRTGRILLGAEDRTTDRAAAAAAIASGVLLPVLFLKGGATLHSILLAYALFAVGVLAMLAWNVVGRSSPQTRATQTRLLPILFLALTIRLIAAQLPGHDFDLPINKGWTQSAAQLGLARSYGEQVGGNVLPNYPPFILILYWLAGSLYQFAISPPFDPLLPDFDVVVRFPAIAADLAACVIVAVVARKAGVRERWPWVAMAYALHPAAVFDTAVWGQTDSVYALWMLLALAALSLGHWRAVGAWTACALLTKPQAAAMFPVLLMVLVRNLPRSAAFFSGAILAAIAILAPFLAGGALDAVLAVYQRTVGGYYNGVSIGAHNFWAIFHRTARLSDDELALNLISFRNAGLLLLTVATLLILWRLRTSLLFPRTQRQRLLGVLLAGALTTSAMFIFATEMHERYQFAYVLLALPVAAVSRVGAFLYAATSCLIFLNLLGSLAFGPVPAALFPKIVGVLQIVLFLLTVGMAPKLVEDLHEKNERPPLKAPPKV